MIIQLHNELIFEVAKQDIDAAKEKIVDIMQNSSQIDVPLLVEVGIGNNWDEAHLASPLQNVGISEGIDV